MGTVLKYTVIYYPVKMNGEDLSPFDQVSQNFLRITICYHNLSQEI